MRIGTVKFEATTGGGRGRQLLDFDIAEVNDGVRPGLLQGEVAALEFVVLELVHCGRAVYLDSDPIAAGDDIHREPGIGRRDDLLVNPQVIQAPGLVWLGGSVRRPISDEYLGF